MKGSLGSLRKLGVYLYVLPAALIMLVMLGYPIIYNFVISFFNWTLRDPEITFHGFTNYIRVLTDHRFPMIVTNTVVWTVLGVVLQMVIGIALALFVDSMRRGKKYMRTIALLPWLIPGVVTALMWRFMFQADVGIINSVLMSIGVTDRNILFLADPNISMFSVIFVNLWRATPFWFLMITAALQSKPIDQIEAATLDGARYPTILRHVLLPYLSPVIATTGVLTTIWTLNYFDLIWVMTRGGPLDSTSTLPVYTFRLAFEFNDFGRSAALAVVSLILVSIMCIPYIIKIFSNLKERGAL
ncbi:MAG: sugar ABC transporter permease [Oscillospiraceae bacterium]|nr:sugar ABC transporter permease [Oscillospiraceae bacterium]